MQYRTIKFIISIFFRGGDWLWSWIKRALRRPLRGTCVVLYYHGVTSKERGSFARQMDMVIRQAKPVRPETRELLESGVCHVSIVFHDAYANIIENALPELVRNKIPATVFVPVNCLGQRANWIEDENDHDYCELIMDAEQLKSLDKDLVSVSSHGESHSNMLDLSEEEAREELCKSKLRLEAIIGLTVELFAFPYGTYSDDLVQWCREAGYKRVFTTLPELAFSEPDAYVTGSVAAYPTDWNLEFRLKLFGAYRWLPNAIAVKQKFHFLLSKWFRRTTPGMSVEIVKSSRSA